MNVCVGVCAKVESVLVCKGMGLTLREIGREREKMGHNACKRERERVSMRERTCLRESEKGIENVNLKRVKKSPSFTA